MNKQLSYAVDRAGNIPYKRGQSRHYCVIVNKRGKVVAEAANSYVTTHPVMAKVSKRVGLDKTFCHAEALALLRAAKKVGKGDKGLSLYVARVDAKGNATNSEPCPVCKLMIEESGVIKNVYHT